MALSASPTWIEPATSAARRRGGGSLATAVPSSRSEPIAVDGLGRARRRGRSRRRARARSARSTSAVASGSATRTRPASRSRRPRPRPVAAGAAAARRSPTPPSAGPPIVRSRCRARNDARTADPIADGMRPPDDPDDRSRSGRPRARSTGSAAPASPRIGTRGRRRRAAPRSSGRPSDGPRRCRRGPGRAATRGRRPARTRRSSGDTGAVPSRSIVAALIRGAPYARPISPVTRILAPGGGRARAGRQEDLDRGRPVLDDDAAVRRVEEEAAVVTEPSIVPCRCRRGSRRRSDRTGWCRSRARRTASATATARRRRAAEPDDVGRAAQPDAVAVRRALVARALTGDPRRAAADRRSRPSSSSVRPMRRPRSGPGRAPSPR